MCPPAPSRPRCRPQPCGLEYHSDVSFPSTRVSLKWGVPGLPLSRDPPGKGAPGSALRQYAPSPPPPRLPLRYALGNPSPQCLELGRTFPLLASQPPQSELRTGEDVNIPLAPPGPCVAGQGGSPGTAPLSPTLTHKASVRGLLLPCWHFFLCSPWGIPQCSRYLQTAKATEAVTRTPAT